MSVSLASKHLLLLGYLAGLGSTSVLYLSACHRSELRPEESQENSVEDVVTESEKEIEVLKLLDYLQQGNFATDCSKQDDPALCVALEFVSKRMLVYGVPKGLEIPPEQIVQDYKVLRKELDSHVVFYFWESVWANEYLLSFHAQHPGCPKGRELEVLPVIWGGFPRFFTVAVDPESLQIAPMHSTFQ